MVAERASKVAQRLLGNVSGLGATADRGNGAPPSAREAPTKSARLNFVLACVAQICDHIFVLWHNKLQHMKQRTFIKEKKNGTSCVRRERVTGEQVDENLPIHNATDGMRRHRPVSLRLTSRGLASSF